MAVKHSKCSCGEAVTILTKSDVTISSRADGNQVVYTQDHNNGADCLYDIFRCKKCLGVIAQTCPDAAYGEKPEESEDEPINPLWYQEQIENPVWFLIIQNILAAAGIIFLGKELLKAVGAL